MTDGESAEKAIARRVAKAGFVAFAPDALHSRGGYPGNDDDGRTLQSSMDRVKIEQDFVAAAKELRSKIKAPLLVQLAELDKRVNDTWPEYEADLKAAKVNYTMQMYPKCNHGFHNDSTGRYDEKNAQLAWERTLAFFKQHLGQG